MKLSELLPTAAIRLDMEGKDKWELISELTDTLVTSGQVEAGSRDAVHDALVARERSMSTGMEKGIAIPHASAPEVEETVVALGIARGGLDFEAIDGQPTHLVFLLVNPANRTKTHIRTLAELARLTSSPELREALREATSADEALDRIRSAEAGVP
ncbi:MAG: PTS sugar transporter subunit IIA [Planctomycetota bacterium]|nr:MAG: PTS sugar transporter subunit IIA [Planctomycetota bacterium]